MRPIRVYACLLLVLLATVAGDRDRSGERDVRHLGRRSGGGGVTGPPMDRFIGVNGFFDDPRPMLREVAGYLRSYRFSKWNAYDLQTVDPAIALGEIAWGFNPSYAGGFDFDATYASAVAVGLDVSPTEQESFMWLVDNLPEELVRRVHRMDEAQDDPLAYRDFALLMYQKAARYGHDPDVPLNTILLRADNEKRRGLGYVRWFEPGNEDDKWWHGERATYSPEGLAAKLSAAWDGHLGTMVDPAGDPNVRFGIRAADPTARVVLPGVAHLDLRYLSRMKAWWDAHRGPGNYPLHALSVHRYANSAGRQRDLSGKGVSPEEFGYESFVLDLVHWRDANMPSAEVWITEFGYDTHPDSPQAPKFVEGKDPLQLQAEWLVRTYLVLAATGVDRAAMYMFRDVDSDSGGIFETSGLVSEKGLWEPKPSYFAMALMRRMLVDTRFERIVTRDSDVRIYRFGNRDRAVYAVWSPRDAATTEVELRLPPTERVREIVAFADGSLEGQSLPVSGSLLTLTADGMPRYVVADRPQSDL